MSSGQYGCDDRGYIRFVEGLVITDPKNPQSKVYKIMRQIGKGTFSRVMQCEDMIRTRKEGRRRLVALKINRNVDKYQAAAKIELEILNAIKNVDSEDHSNCAHLIHSFDYHGHKSFVFPLFGRSVYGFLSHNKYVPFANLHVKQFSWQMIHAVKFMHNIKIIFTDLKPENIVYVKDRTRKLPILALQEHLPSAFKYWLKRMGSAGYSEKDINKLEVEIPTDTRLKVIDFGSALFESRWHNHLVQTRHYRAPEVVLGMKWGFPIDVWSIGCIMLEFIYGRMVYNTHDSIDHLNQMITMIGPMPSSFKAKIPKEAKQAFYDKEGKLNLKRAKISGVQCQPLKNYFNTNIREDKLLLDLISKMLRWDPASRISAADAMKHDYFADVDTINHGLWPPNPRANQ